MSVGLREKRSDRKRDNISVSFAYLFSYSYLGSDSTDFHKLTRHVERARRE